MDDDERREHARYATRLAVDVQSGEHFLFAYITNISAMGIFVRTNEPLPVGTELTLAFGVEPGPRVELDGMVVWVNPVRLGPDNSGMGVQFEPLTPEQRETLVELVRSIAYLHEQAPDA